VGVLAMGFALACAEPPPRPSLILISIDTLRADRLGSYGYERDTSPSLDALAARGVRFEAVVAESSWTLPSHMTLFTGLPPSVHGVTSDERRLSAEIPMLSEVLREDGYRTFAFTGGLYVAPNFGFGRGFESYASALRHYSTGAERPIPLDMALDGTLKRIAELGPAEPFFAFVHTFDVHCPYDPPEAYTAKFDSRPESDHVETADRCGDPDFNEMDLTPGQARFLSDRYDAGIRHADDLLGAFFEKLGQAGVLERTFVAVVSDHGEEFLEHGRIGHQASLFIECLRIPWIVAGPGLAPAVVREPVGLADVMPTLLALLGVPAPETEGASMLAVMRGERPEDPDRIRFSELGVGPEVSSAIRGDLHVLADRSTGSLRVFDWRRDRTEQNDLAGSDPARDRGLAQELKRHWSDLESSPFRRPPGIAEGISDEQRAQLRALGYVD
jgi:arylsulfatase A-like enzyme